MSRVSYDRHQPSQQNLSLYDFTEGQSAIERLVSDLYDRAPFLDGNLLTGVSLTTGENLIDHKLGRAPRGWRKVRDSVAPVSFRAYLASDQSLSASTITTITFDTESYDYGGVFDTSNGRFTAPHGGLYDLLGKCAVESVADGKQVSCRFDVNGSYELRGFTAAPGQSQWQSTMCHGVFDLAEDDYVEFRVQQDDTVSRNVDGGTEGASFFGRALVGLFDQQIGHTDEVNTLRLWSQCDRTADLWVW